MTTTKKKLCPRQGCQRQAIIDVQYGVLPCREHQEEDNIPLHRRPEFYNLSKRNRIQGQRDEHEGDMVQPFIGNKINPEFARLYPDRAKDYFTDKELKSI